MTFYIIALHDEDNLNGDNVIKITPSEVSSLARRGYCSIRLIRELRKVLK